MNGQALMRDSVTPARYGEPKKRKSHPLEGDPRAQTRGSKSGSFIGRKPCAILSHGPDIRKRPMHSIAVAADHLEDLIEDLHIARDAQ